MPLLTSVSRPSLPSLLSSSPIIPFHHLLSVWEHNFDSMNPPYQSSHSLSCKLYSASPSSLPFPLRSSPSNHIIYPYDSRAAMSNESKWLVRQQRQRYVPIHPAVKTDGNRVRNYVLKLDVSSLIFFSDPLILHGNYSYNCQHRSSVHCDSRDWCAPVLSYYDWKSSLVYSILINSLSSVPDTPIFPSTLCI